jgi:hypothetical protein
LDQDPTRQQSAPLAGDNSLPDLAGRIRVEHEAVSESLKESVRHAIAAGELLIEAKGQLSHGRWLPWLKDHCTISERTAQLYMRVAKSRTEVEDQMRNGVADLSLNEAAALLMLSSDVRKLLNFAKQTEGLSGEALLEFCVANNVGVMHDPNYDPFARCSDAEHQEWLVFVLFLSYDGAAGRAGFDPDEAWHHVEYLLQRPFQNVDEWLGPEGDDWRRKCGSSNYQPTDGMRVAWAAFRDARRHLTLADIDAEGRTLSARFHEDKAARVIKPDRRRRARRAA